MIRVFFSLPLFLFSLSLFASQFEKELSSLVENSTRLRIKLEVERAAWSAEVQKFNQEEEYRAKLLNEKMAKLKVLREKNAKAKKRDAEVFAKISSARVALKKIDEACSKELDSAIFKDTRTKVFLEDFFRENFSAMTTSEKFATICSNLERLRQCDAELNLKNFPHISGIFTRVEASSKTNTSHIATIKVNRAKGGQK